MANLIDTFLNQLTAEEKRDKTSEQYGGKPSTCMTMRRTNIMR